MAAIIVVRRDSSAGSGASAGRTTGQRSGCTTGASLDPSAGGNPIPVNAAQLEHIFRAAVAKLTFYELYGSKQEAFLAALEAVDLVAVFGEDTPLGRPGQPAEIAAQYVLLASHEASFTTGNVWGSTGGETGP